MEAAVQALGSTGLTNSQPAQLPICCRWLGCCCWCGRFRLRLLGGASSQLLLYSRQLNACRPRRGPWHLPHQPLRAGRLGRRLAGRHIGGRLGGGGAHGGAPGFRGDLAAHARLALAGLSGSEVCIRSQRDGGRRAVGGQRARGATRQACGFALPTASIPSALKSRPASGPPPSSASPNTSPPSAQPAPAQRRRGRTRALHLRQARLEGHAAHRLAVEGSQEDPGGEGKGAHPGRGEGSRKGECREGWRSTGSSHLDLGDPQHAKRQQQLEGGMIP